MKRHDRFYLPNLAERAPGDIVDLDARESGHAVRVKRHVAGDTVELFDGAGRRASAAIVDVDRRRGARVRVTAVRFERPPARFIHLACAVPRGDRMETLLDMVTQLGVSRVTPLVFEHSTAAGGGKNHRWHRVLIEACKQSRRDHLPSLDPLTPFSAWLSRVQDDSALWLADPDGREAGSLHHDGRCLLVVGPEGGLSDAERVSALAAGFEPVAVGENILRVETAAVAAVAAASLVAG